MITSEELNNVLGLPERLEDYSYEDAIRLTQVAIGVKDSMFLHFSLACFYSMGDKIEESLMELEIALKQGFSDWDKIVTEFSLSRVKMTPEFWEIIAKYVPDQTGK